MKNKFKNMDKFLFLLIVIYTILGLVMIFSASSMTAVLEYGKSESYFFVKQLVFTIMAYIAGFVILFIPNKLIDLVKKMSKVIVLVSIGLLSFTLLFGKEINGSKAWLKFKPLFNSYTILLYKLFVFLLFACFPKIITESVRGIPDLI